VNKSLFLIAATVLTIAMAGQARSQSASGVEDLSKPAGQEPPMMGIHWARGFNPLYLARKAGHPGSQGKSPDLLWHNGPIMPDAVTENIFWGTSWGRYTGDEITGLDLWYNGFDRSDYAKASDEYTGTDGQEVTPTTTHLGHLIGHLIDGSAASGGSHTSVILAEVCKEITAPDASGNGYYAVYTDLPRGNSSYCAWHSFGTCGGVRVQFAFFWKLDGDPGCDPQSTVTTESQGLAALANVSGHELSEARTDPTSEGWYDTSGEENADKCEWTFGEPYVTFSNRTIWKIQGLWSNAAYNQGTGYPNSRSQDGCIEGP
jgi:hypothetical protein